MYHNSTLMTADNFVRFKDWNYCCSYFKDILKGKPGQKAKNGLSWVLPHLFSMNVSSFSFLGHMIPSETTLNVKTYRLFLLLLYIKITKCSNKKYY